jgi:predicted amidophosphoribosyltransferase
MPFDWEPVAARHCRLCARDDVAEDIWISTQHGLLCHRCAGADSDLLAVTAAYRARPFGTHPIVAYKEREQGWQDLEVPLALALRDSVATLALPDDTLVVPVPSYRDRRPHMQRLTTALPNARNARNALRKIIDIHQTGLGRRARREQSEDAYRVRWYAPVRGRTVIVTDDVYTTGATLDACAAALMEAGAAAVYGATILRIIPRPPAVPVVSSTGQITVRFTEPDKHGQIVCPKDGDLWVRFGCSPTCPHVLTAGPLHTPTAHVDVHTQWLCPCHTRHEIHLTRFGPRLRVTVPPRRPTELLVAVQIPAP